LRDVDLKKVEKHQTPKSKLEALTNTYKLVVKSLELLKTNTDEVGAEDSIPLLVYLYSRKKLNHIMSTIK